MRLTATQSFPYDGRQLRAGDEFEASARDAEVLMRAGRAEASAASSKPAETEAEAAPAEEEAALLAKPRRRYKRRDLMAEEP